MGLNSINKIRFFPLMILFYLLFMILLQASDIFSGQERTIIFTARPSKKFPEKTYHQVETKEFTYVTGMEGQVYWKSKTRLESFTLNFFANQNAMITALGAVYTLILDVILFWMLYDLKPENIFSKKISRGGKCIFYLSLLLLGKDVFQYYISDYFLKQLTQGRFEAAQQTISFALLPYFIGMLAFPLFMKFFLQAQKTEQEQQLTV